MSIHLADELYTTIPYLYADVTYIEPFYSTSTIPFIRDVEKIPPNSYDAYIAQPARLSRDEIIKQLTLNPTPVPTPTPVPAPIPRHAPTPTVDSDVEISCDEPDEPTYTLVHNDEKKHNDAAEAIIYSNMSYPLSSSNIANIKQHISVLKSLADEIYNVINANNQLPAHVILHNKYNYLLTVIAQGREFYFTSMCDHTLPLYLLDEIINYYDMLDVAIGLHWQ